MKYPLKCCPWCNKTPVFRMNTETDETWLPRIQCDFYECKVQPKTHSVPIRNDQRYSAFVIRCKVEAVIEYWNQGELTINSEGFELDYEKIVEDFKKGILGSLAGYRG